MKSWAVPIQMQLIKMIQQFLMMVHVLLKSQDVLMKMQLIITLMLIQIMAYVNTMNVLIQIMALRIPTEMVVNGTTVTPGDVAIMMM